VDRLVPENRPKLINGWLEMRRPLHLRFALFNAGPLPGAETTRSKRAIGTVSSWSSCRHNPFARQCLEASELDIAVDEAHQLVCYGITPAREYTLIRGPGNAASEVFAIQRLEQSWVQASHFCPLRLTCFDLHRFHDLQPSGRNPSYRLVAKPCSHLLDDAPH